jgi:zona occludens toxin
MIEFYTGVSGSGKTYRAVYYLYEIFLNSKSKDFGKFKKFYTNINEFNFSFFSDGVGFNLDFDVLLKYLTILHKAYLDKQTDAELNILADSFGLKDAFFVFDECQNYFDKKNTVLIWWLSYHRHFYQNIILITQNLSLIEAKYKGFSEFFYLAVPSSLRVFLTKFKYVQYIGSRMSKAQKSETISIKFDAEVYKLYHSGDNTQSKRVIYKYLIIALFALFAFFLVIFLVVHFLFSSKDKKHLVNDKNISQRAKSFFSQTNSKIIDIKKSDSLSVTIICSSFGCYYNTDFYSLSYMKYYIKKYKLFLLNVSSISDGQYVYKYRVSDNNFFKDLSYD